VTQRASPCGEAALTYCQNGRSVFPVRPDKKPLVKWAPYQTTPAAQSLVEQWWSKWPNAGIGCACGAVSGVVVLDVDGAAGFQELRRLNLRIPDTLTVRTGRGWHFYFQDPGVKTKNFTSGKTAFPLPHVDFRGHGGYVILPPSLHQQTGRRYQWENDREPAPLPPWLCELVIEASPRGNGRDQSSPRVAVQPRALAPLAERILEEAIRTATPGTRNETGLWLACQLRDNAMPEPEAESLLIRFAASVGKHGDHLYTEEEARETVRSAYSRPPREPWAAGSDPSWAGLEQTHSSGGQEAPGPYRIEDGRIVRAKQTKDGPMTEALCNFTARVTEEVALDDGVESARAFLIEGTLETGEPLPPARVQAARFAGMQWVAEHWGLRAIVRAGQATKDYLREAIQRLSPEATHRHVFTHTGWRELEGASVYLTAGGAVGRAGYEVDLGPELSRYHLPRVATDPRRAMEASLALLRIAPLPTTAPLWAGMFRAPLATACPLDMSLWMEGQTGSLKSTLAALFLCHFGTFDRTHLPGTWSSTANHLERRAFLLKDTVFVIDDYAPTLLDARELEVKASRLLRAQGNLAGRGRLRSDLSERPTYSPRGLILATGEQHPPGQSLLARTILMELDRAAVDLEALSAAQETAALLPHAMTGYLTWLAPQMATLPEQLRTTFEGTRAKATASREHLRVPEALAHLWLGLHTGLCYAEEIGACSHEDAEVRRDDCWKALLALGQAQGRLVEEERPTRRFLTVLANVLTQRRATLLRKEEGGDPTAGGPDVLGWADEAYLYLLPDGAFQTVARFCREGGIPFSSSFDRLKRDLAKEQLSEYEPERYTATVRIAGKTRRVLKLKRPAVEHSIGQDFPAPSPVITSITSFGE
jgi:hypothetical protein